MGYCKIHANHPDGPCPRCDREALDTLTATVTRVEKERDAGNQALFDAGKMTGEMTAEYKLRVVNHQDTIDALVKVLALTKAIVRAYLGVFDERGSKRPIVAEKHYDRLLAAIKDPHGKSWRTM